MAILKELSAKAGTYKDRNTGEEKQGYVKVGVMLETRNGEALKIESLPVGFDGWIYMRDPKPREESQRQADTPRESKSVADMPDDIPF